MSDEQPSAPLSGRRSTQQSLRGDHPVSVAPRRRGQWRAHTPREVGERRAQRAVSCDMPTSRFQVHLGEADHTQASPRPNEDGGVAASSPDTVDDADMLGDVSAGPTVRLPAAVPATAIFTGSGAGRADPASLPLLLALGGAKLPEGMSCAPDPHGGASSREEGLRSDVGGIVHGRQRGNGGSVGRGSVETGEIVSGGDEGSAPPGGVAAEPELHRAPPPPSLHAALPSRGQGQLPVRHPAAAAPPASVQPPPLSSPYEQHTGGAAFLAHARPQQHAAPRLHQQLHGPRQPPGRPHPVFMPPRLPYHGPPPQGFPPALPLQWLPYGGIPPALWFQPHGHHPPMPPDYWSHMGALAAAQWAPPLVGPPLLPGFPPRGVHLTMQQFARPWPPRGPGR